MAAVKNISHNLIPKSGGIKLCPPNSRRPSVNQIDAGVEFSYQGETYNPKATIDLDVLMQNHGELPDLHLYLARQFGIDTYS